VSQPTLFDAPPWAPARFEPPFVTEPLARNSDPGPSHRAAEAAFASLAPQSAAIVHCLRGMGARGGTAFEIAEALGYGWDSVIVSRRIAGLRVTYVLSLDGEQGRPLLERKHRGHRPMTVHIAREFARARAA